MDNQLPQLYDNLGIFHTSARSCHTGPKDERDMVAAELLYQMAEYTLERIAKIKASSKAGGRRETK